MLCSKRIKYACYSSNISMSLVGNVSPILFLTFRNMYGLTYSMLGLLVTINFLTQLCIDLVFSFFSHRFNIEKTVKIMPVLTLIGLLIYSLWPFFYPDSAYLGIVVGTVIFSASAGLGEVLISPIIAALPSKNPEHEMSKLHSVYAWGVVAVVIICTLLLFVLGSANWNIIVLIFCIIPIVSIFLFYGIRLPDMETVEKMSGVINQMKNKTLWMCVCAIFLGGASEIIMAQWCSGYLEQSFLIPKIWGDIFGVALFSVMLGFGRTLYSKIGSNIMNALLYGSIGAAVCYFIAAVVNNPFVGLAACGFTGFCVSMLWPGSLIAVADRIKGCGVFVYALMAAGGDCGASVGPQLVRVITDFAISNPSVRGVADVLNLLPEQFGMKMAMLVGMLFPLCCALVCVVIKKTNKN